MAQQPDMTMQAGAPSRAAAPLRLTRLKKRAEFVRTACGVRAVTPGLVLQCRPSARNGAQGAARVGFTATKKLGGAVVRNRVKRRLRAAASRVMPARALPGYDYVLIGRSGTAARAFNRLVEDLETALHRVHRKPPRERRPAQRERRP